MRVTSVVIFCALIFAGASSVSAQTDNRWGVVMAFPTAAGLQWQANDRLTFRGDVAFDHGVVEQVVTSGGLFINGVQVSSSSSRTTEFRHSTFSLGMAGLFTVARREQLRLYVSPRVAWRRLDSSFETRDDDGPQTAFDSATTTNGLEVEGTFGANYRLGDRFSVFGETGIGFTSPTASSASASETRSYVVGSRGTFGVVVHF